MNLDTKCPSCPFVKEGKKSTRLGDVFPRHACLNEWPAEVGVGLGDQGAGMAAVEETPLEAWETLERLTSSHRGGRGE